MVLSAKNPDPPNPGMETIHLPATIEANQSTVRRGFWRKIRKYATRIPFVDEATAAYFCAIDPATPLRVKAVLLAALAYFIMPADLVPDFITGLGFTDDATVLATAVGLVSQHIKPDHHKAAARALGRKTAENAGDPDRK